MLSLTEYLIDWREQRQRTSVSHLNCVAHFKGAIHTSELDRSEIDLSPKRSECERSNAPNWDRSKIDLNECEHFLKDPT